MGCQKVFMKSFLSISFCQSYDKEPGVCLMFLLWLIIFTREIDWVSWVYPPWGVFLREPNPYLCKWRKVKKNLTKNSEWLGRQAWYGFAPSTSCLSALRAELWQSLIKRRNWISKQVIHFLNSIPEFWFKVDYFPSVLLCKVKRIMDRYFN